MMMLTIAIALGLIGVCLLLNLVAVANLRDKLNRLDGRVAEHFSVDPRYTEVDDDGQVVVPAARAPFVATDTPYVRGSAFEADLQQLINKHSQESGCDTPDFLLAEFLVQVKHLFDHYVNERTAWYSPEGRKA